jgi:hypothetical protein
MRIAWWKPKVTNTHSEYVIIFAFLHQQWLREPASVFRYTYVACLVKLFTVTEKVEEFQFEIHVQCGILLIRLKYEPK